jgi:hypothetical protein
LFAFDFFEPLPVQVEVSDTPLTFDAGLLLRRFLVPALFAGGLRLASSR